MPKFNKSKKDYNLNSSFAAGTPESKLYDYDVSASEKLVTWIRMENSTSPKDLGPYKLSPVYENTPVKGTARVGNKSYPAVTLSDSSDTSVQVTSTSGHLSFTDLASAGTPTSSSDRPFSVSVWLKISAYPGSYAYEYIFSKSGAGPGSSEYEYRAMINEDGKLVFLLRDEHSSKTVYILSNVAGSITLGKWHHTVFTYDGRGGTNAQNGLTIYVDGVVNDTSGYSGGAGYVGMKPYWPGILYVGGYQGGTVEFDGSLSEFAMWAKELSAEEVLAVYNGASYGSHEIISGYLNNPPRILLQERDNHTGSYPTVARSGDPDFTGRRKVHFNDTKSIEFRSSYATAEIDFLAVPSGGDSIVLKRANATDPVQFDFLRGGVTTADPSSDHQGVLIAGNDMTVEKVASQFALAVEDAMPTIEAKTIGSKVKLRYHPVSTGLTMGASLITSSSASTSNPINISVKHFSQSGPENYVYPLILDENSVFLNDRTASPNSFSTSTSIVGPSIMNPGVSDAGISFTPGESLSPFDECRIGIKDTEFYAVGTDPKVLPGFSERLASKVSFSVDIDPTEETEIFFSTGSVSAATVACPVNSGLAYFNFTDKKWEIIGDLTTGSNVDFLSSDFAKFTGSMVATTPSPNYWISDGRDDPDSMNVRGMPDPSAGFPVASKFDATGSQLLKMSDYITGPFLLEKVTIEVSGTLGSIPSFMYSGKPTDPTVNTVMLLNQFGTPLNSRIQGITLYGTGSGLTGTQMYRSSSLTYQNTTRYKDVILYGRVATFATGAGSATDRIITETDWVNNYSSKVCKWN